MGYQFVAAVCIVVTFVLMSFVVKRYGTGDRPAQSGEVLVMAVLWAVTMGPLLYVNPGMPQIGFWNPPLLFVDKVLNWVLGLLLAVVMLRTFVGAGGFGRKVLMAFLGAVLALFTFLGLGAVFGMRTIGVAG